MTVIARSLAKFVDEAVLHTPAIDRRTEGRSRLCDEHDRAANSSPGSAPATPARRLRHLTLKHRASVRPWEGPQHGDRDDSRQPVRDALVPPGEGNRASPDSSIHQRT